MGIHIKELIETIISSKDLTAKNLGLRFDRVALQLLNELERWAMQSVPKNKAVLLAITAPIRLRAKTEMALKDKVSDLVAKPRRDPHEKFVINKNRIELLVTKTRVNSKIRFVGFVHNPSVSSQRLLELAKDWLLSGNHSMSGEL